ncbi:MAG: MBL fold metallo-hydrolase [Chitinivibrionales bacterium]|nr:MBL fold metallo-hydrolase [Chitinivibrionales bacterium]
MTLLKVQKIPAAFFGPRPDTLMAWLGMAGLLVNSRGTVVLIDPVITLMGENGTKRSEHDYQLKVPSLPIESSDVPRVDAILHTHAEDDHFGAKSTAVFEQRLAPQYMGPAPLVKRLREIGVPEDRTTSVKDFERHSFGNISIEISPAMHDHNPQNPWKRGDCCGYILHTPDGTIWHPGDTRLIWELLQFKNVDVLMWDAAYMVNTHLGPDGSAALARSCGAKIMMAYHYGTFEAPRGDGSPPYRDWARALESDPADSLPFAKDCPGTFLTLCPGEPLLLPL